jgi:hypothetical protein
MQYTRPSLYHAVQFYGNEEHLFSRVAGFLAEGLIEGHPAVVIATGDHQPGITRHLEARLIHVERARRNGDLLFLDAHEMLDLFTHDGIADPEAFDLNIGRFVEQTLQGRPGSAMRAYGEMVDVLWKQGLTETAIRLEMMWNALAARFGFSLMCGYSMEQFCKRTPELHEVCNQHTHVFGPEQTHPFNRFVTH